MIALMMSVHSCKKQGQDPSAEINAIRKRAYGGGTNFPVFVNGTFQTNEIAIFEERGKEFVAEGKCWYDLRRMHLIQVPDPSLKQLLWQYSRG